MANDGGLSRFQKRMAAIPKEVKKAVVPALEKGGQDMAETARLFAESSADTRELIGSIVVTGPGQRTPAHSQPGGSYVVPENQVAVTAGDSDVRYAHLVEYGTVKAPAQPFFWPAYRLTKKRTLGRVNRAMNAAIKKYWGG